MEGPPPARQKLAAVGAATGTISSAREGVEDMAEIGK
jgi:hypothetical protein